MYQNPIGPVAVVTGATVLPNTGGNQVVFVAALLTTTIGLAIVLTTVARMVAKKAYKA